MSDPTVNKHFSKISAVIDIEKLERENMKFFYTGFVIGVFVSFMSIFFISYTPPEFPTAQREAAPHMKVTLVSVPSRAQEIKNEELEKARALKSLIEEILRIENLGRKFTFKGLDGKVGAPRDMEFRDIEEAVQYVLKTQGALLDSLIYEIDPILGNMDFYNKYHELIISRIPEDNYAQLDELMTIEDIDSQEKYKGFVVRDPNDKQNLKGFLRIPMIAQTAGMKAVNGLAEAFHYYTAVKVIVDDNFINLDTRRLLDYPFVYILSYRNQVFRMNENERKNFALYLKDGGFALFDNSEPWNGFSPGEASLYLMLADALGEDFDFRPIPYNHPLYNCFFDIEGLAPEGTENWGQYNRLEGQVEWGFLARDRKMFNMLKGISEKVSTEPYALWGVWFDNRLVAIYSDKGYGYIWREGPLFSFESNYYYSGSEEKYDFNPQLKLGVNVIVYALLRENGVSKKVTNYSTQNK
ncbi:DUF4159 domain-containing protein [Candidatus Latescibacterota bacterium]